MSLGPNYLHYNPMPIDSCLFPLLLSTFRHSLILPPRLQLRCDFAFDCNFNFATDIDFVLVFGFLLVTFCCFGFLGRVIVHSAHTHRGTHTDNNNNKKNQLHLNHNSLCCQSQNRLPFLRLIQLRCCAACCAQNSTKNQQQ